MSRISHEEFFVVRTPRLALEELYKLGESEQQTNAALEEWLAMPGVEEAIYLASPSLLERIALWRSKPDSKQGKKVAQALLKYMIRMSSRPTPFGLFSGIARGKVGEESRLICGNYTRDKRQTRLDMFYLNAIREHLFEQDPEKSGLTYFPNPSIYFVADQCRYIEAYQSDETIEYRLSAVEGDEYFRTLLALAEAGASFSQLVSGFMVRFPEADLEEVSGYIRELMAESLLIADIPLPLTGQAPDRALMTSLLHCGKRELADALDTALEKMAELDEARSSDADTYRQLFNHLQAMPVKPMENKLFQTDVYRSFDSCTLAEEELQALKQKLALISSLSHSDKTSSLDDFVTRFNARFEGQFVPLDVLLDDETGIGVSSETGYEAPLVAGLNLVRDGKGGFISKQPSPLDRAIEQALSLPKNQGADEIRLSLKELKRLQRDDHKGDLPASFAAMFSLFRDESQRSLFKLGGCYGPSAANLLGRFCHLDEDLLTDVRAHLSKEESCSPDAVFAEIVHMPDGRPGNVIARPQLREYEIVFMADSSLDPEFQLPLNDLYVFVEGREVKLWSKRLNKRVIPRLSSAHNYSSRSLSAYKFLCLMQHQDGRAPRFSMPVSTAHASFVPRVCVDNLILSEKTWRIERARLAELVRHGSLDRDKLERLCSDYRLDYIVNFAVFDNVLQLDLRNIAMLEILLAETRGRESVELKEVLSETFQSAITDAQGRHYNNEIILPFFNPDAVPHKHGAENPLANIHAKPIKRRFSAGSEWLSLKIYSGNSMLEQLLAEDLLALIEQSEGLFQKWFFIRYGDPDWHIRLRFQGEPARLCGELLPRLNALLDPLIESGQLHKVELMTYEREVERYGGPDAMDLIETLFMADSRLIARVCGALDEFGENLRWRLALLCTDRLLTLFGYDAERKLALITRLREGFGREFNESGLLRKQLGNRYREYQAIIDDDFAKLNLPGAEGLNDAQNFIAECVAEWQQMAEHAIAELKVLSDAGRLNASLDGLLGSLLHMHSNRLFKAYGREQELVIHDLLRRKYFSSARQG